MRNKVALTLLALAAAAVAAGCGGSGEARDIAGSTPTTPMPPARRVHTDPHKGCAEQGIDARTLGVGACTEGGLQYVVANYGGVVKLRTLAVTIIGVGVAPQDRGNGRSARPLNEAFVSVTLQVQNRDKVAHRFGFGQTMLGIGDNNFIERVDVERNIHQGAIATTNGGMVGPGETLRGDVVFDINEEDYEQLQARGRFFIWNFGGHAAPRIPRSVRQVGQIRLYAVERS